MSGGKGRRAKGYGSVAFTSRQGMRKRSRVGVNTNKRRGRGIRCGGKRRRG